MSYNRSVRGAALFPSIPATTLRWVLRLRWSAVTGQLLTIAIARLGFALELPTAALAGVVAFTALSNLGIQRWMRTEKTVSAELLALVLGTDTLALCAMLYLTGGPTNPLSVLFLVQITIASLVLRTRYAVGIMLLSMASYAFLFFANVPLPGTQAHVHHPGMVMPGSSAVNLHLQGMFAAFALAAILINYFVSRLASALREREAELALAERAAAANERLASLSTLAAGAAHELGTPLGTIAVAAKELERAAESSAIADDARLIRQEVARCRDIVQQMSARAPGALGEVSERVAIDDVLREVKKRLDESSAERLDVDVGPIGELKVPLAGLSQVLASLIKNAFDASGDERVRLVIESNGRRTSFAVIDHGHGITAEELSHVGEPFFTTKVPGAGMGLGVFLARAFADRFGGGLTLESEPEKGTRAVLELPVET